MKVFIAGLGTETNTFSPIPTGLNDYAVVRPADVAERGWDALEEVIYGGSLNVFQQMAHDRGWEVVFGLHAFAQPAGTTTRTTYETLRDEMLSALEAALPVDMALFFMHGAMVAEGYDDCESDMLQRIRKLVGPEAKVGVEFDLHCDITQGSVDAADAIVLFKEYPHTDVKDRAAELFNIIAGAALGEVMPTMALFDCRMIGGSYRTPFEPVRGFVDEMMVMEGKNGVLSVSLAHGFGWADVPSNGLYMLAITDNNPTLANQVAEQLGRKFYAMRHSASPKMPSMQEALDKALAIPYSGKPVVVADRADNAGGGAPSDSTFVLRELLNRKATNVGLALMWDPIAVQIAMAGGVGAELQLRLGGKIGPTSGDPLDLTVKVKGIVPNLIQQWPQSSGTMAISCGDSVCLGYEGITIIVGSLRTQVLGLDLFTAFGLDPRQFHLIVVKSTQHFYAAYAPIAAEIIYMDAPGTLVSDMTLLDFKRVDKGKYPWVEDPLGTGL